VSYNAWPASPYPDAQPVLPPPRPRASRGAILGLVLALAGVLVLTGVGIAAARPSGGAGGASSGGDSAQDAAVQALWRTIPANQLLPATLSREGSETYSRLAVDPDESCASLPAPFAKALSPATCRRVVQATYVDRTQTVTATVGIVVLGGSIVQRRALFQNWTADAYAKQTTMMPRTYPVPGTVAAGFGGAQRVTWESEISTDGTYLVYAVAGFTDGRAGPSAAARSAGKGTALENDSPPVQVAADLPDAVQNVLAAKESSLEGAS
jgi:hypothetical protein